MRRLVLLSAIGLLVTIALAPAYADEWAGKCVWVKEGHTLIVMHEGKSEEIRLHGVCCPKWGQDYALEAARFTQNIALDKIVEVKPRPEKNYGRTVARVFIEDKCLNEELVPRRSGNVEPVLGLG